MGSSVGVQWAQLLCVFAGMLDGHGAVVIKRLHENVTHSSRDFEAATAVLASLRHPHIVQLLGYGMCGNHGCLVFPHFQVRACRICSNLIQEQLVLRSCVWLCSRLLLPLGSCLLVLCPGVPCDSLWHSITWWSLGHV